MSKDKVELPIDAINQLSEILKAQELTEIEVEASGFTIKVRKEQQVVAQAVSAQPAAAVSAPAAASSAAPAADPNVHEVKSPMVGTFYQAASPGADPFIKVGDKVKKGDTLCIVEAMKLMNELPSEIEGEVVEICVSDAEAISYGQTLIKIRK